MNLIWFFTIVFVVLIFAGCAAFLKFKDPPPDVILIVTDVHGNKERYALDHIRELKVIVSRKIKYEIEYMLEEELDSGEERQHELRD